MCMGLLLIDLQNDYFPGGAYELAQAEAAVKQAEKVLCFFRRSALPVFHVQHVNKNPQAAFLKVDTLGCFIHERVRPQLGEPVIKKHMPDSFFQTDLKVQLEGQRIKRLVICGMMTHMCVDSTVRTAKHFGYDLTVIQDACAARDLIWENNKIEAAVVQAAFIAALHQRFARIVTADCWIQEANRCLE